MKQRRMLFIAVLMTKATHSLINSVPFLKHFLLVYFHIRLFNDVSQLRGLYAIQ